MTPAEGSGAARDGAGDSLAALAALGALRLPLYGLFILSILYTLYLTRDIALPITLAVLASLLLAPAVHGLARRGVPRAVGAFVLLSGLVGAVGGIGALVANPMLDWMEEAPQGIAQLLVTDSGVYEAYERMTRSAREVEETVEGLRQEEDADEAPTTVVLESESWRGQLVVNAQRNLVRLALALALCYFLLVSGDRLATQFIAQLGSRARRRTALTVIRQSQREIARYLIVITASNSLVGLVTGLLAWGVGLPSPAVWGVVATLLRFIPYLGVGLTAALLLVISAITLSEPWMMLVVPGGYLLLNTLVGFFLEPYIHGYRMSINPVVVFLSIFFWGWLWGAIGVLLAVPLMTVIQVLLSHIDALKPVHRVLAR